MVAGKRHDDFARLSHARADDLGLEAGDQGLRSDLDEEVLPLHLLRRLAVDRAVVVQADVVPARHASPFRRWDELRAHVADRLDPFLDVLIRDDGLFLLDRNIEVRPKLDVRQNVDRGGEPERLALGHLEIAERRVVHWRNARFLESAREARRNENLDHLVLDLARVLPLQDRRGNLPGTKARNLRLPGPRRPGPSSRRATRPPRGLRS